MHIVQRETLLAPYKGLRAVLSGIVPKMAIRSAGLEAYKGRMGDEDTGRGRRVLKRFLSVGLFPWGRERRLATAGVGACVTEGVAVVTPMEVVKKKASRC